MTGRYPRYFASVCTDKTVHTFSHTLAAVGRVSYCIQERELSDKLLIRRSLTRLLDKKVLLGIKCGGHTRAPFIYSAAEPHILITLSSSRIHERFAHRQNVRYRCSEGSLHRDGSDFDPFCTAWGECTPGPRLLGLDMSLSIPIFFEDEPCSVIMETIRYEPKACP